jgi:hypothetical protein
LNVLHDRAGSLLKSVPDFALLPEIPQDSGIDLKTRKLAFDENGNAVDSQETNIC